MTSWLPIVARELRVAARRRTTHWARVGAALVSSAVCGWHLLAAVDWQTAMGAGRGLFMTLAGLAFVFCLLLGFTFTADSLSEERREGTLGLLFLTDLRGYDVVLGKLVAYSLNALLGLLAMLPVMAVPLLIGGVSMGEFWRMALVLLVTLLFSLAAGTAISAFSQQGRTAMLGALLLVGVVTAVLPWLGEKVGVWHSGVKTALNLLSPAYAFYLASGLSRPGEQGLLWLALAVNLTLSLLLLGGAAFVAPRVWRRASISGFGAAWRRWYQWYLYGNEQDRRSRRKRLLAINPYLWLAMRERSKTLMCWVFLAIMVVLWLWGYRSFGRQWPEGSTLPMALLTHVAFKVWIASEATHRMAEDAHSGALELLLSTPLSERRISRGILGALHRQFGLPLLAVAVGDASLVVLCNVPSLWQAMLVLVLVLVLDFYTLAWVGIWQGLSTGKVQRAFVGTLLRVLVLPTVIFIVVLFLEAPRLMGPEGLPLLWLGICVVVDGVLVLVAHVNLRQRFRDVAAGRFQTETAAPAVPIARRSPG